MNTIFIISNIFIFGGIAIYIYNTINKNISLNPSTRLIRILLEIIDVISYINIVKENIKGLMAIISLLGVITITTVAISKGKFKKITKFDGLLLSIGIITIIIGLISKNYIVTNLLLQTGFIIGYIPTIKGLYKKEIKDSLRPWLITSIGIILAIIGLIIYYEGRFTLVYPISRLSGNLGIVIAIYITQKRGKNPISQ